MVSMHRLFQNFVDGLSSALEREALRDAMAEAATALDLSCFAYLTIRPPRGSAPQLISTYPSDWTNYYLQNGYERFDPVIMQALHYPEPFEWGLGFGSTEPSELQRTLLEEAAKFGIRCGFTVPIHNSRGPMAAVTFAADERRPQFVRCIREHARVLQLMAVYFDAHARRKLGLDHSIDGVTLSPREFECLEWAAKGKTAWETGHILGISRRTAAFHLDNAKAKLGVHSICQAVARLIASRPTMDKSTA
jgi:LuxR family transcriptional activator of conjugal transfer of Ti plasmids